MQTKRLLVAMYTSQSRAGVGRGKRGRVSILNAGRPGGVFGDPRGGIDPTKGPGKASGSSRRRRLGFGEIAGPPEIPAGYRAERRPSLAAFEDHIRLGQVARFERT